MLVPTTTVLLTLLVESCRPTDDLYGELAAMTGKTNHQYAECLIELTPALLDNVLSKPRDSNYSVVILFTVTGEQLKLCQSCNLVKSELVLLCSSCIQSGACHSNTPIFFTFFSADSDQQAPAIFSRIGVTRVPHLWLVDTNSRRVPLQISTETSRAEYIAQWIKDAVQVDIQVFRPLSSRTSKLLSVVLGIAVLLGVMIPHIVMNSEVRQLYIDNLMNRRLIGHACCMVVLSCTSGQLWNIIRGAPIIHIDNDRVAFFSRGTSNQLAFESYLIMAVYALASGTLVYVDKLITDGDAEYGYLTQSTASKTLVCLTIFTMTSTAVTSIFKAKT